jgi:hypothetical protein
LLVGSALDVLAIHEKTPWLFVLHLYDASAPTLFPAPDAERHFVAGLALIGAGIRIVPLGDGVPH